MGIYRCYSGDNGESHLEQLDFDSRPELQELQKSEGLNFRRPGVGGPAPGIVNDPRRFPLRSQPALDRDPPRFGSRWLGRR